MSDLIKLKNRHRTIISLNSVMNAMLVVTAAKVQKAKARLAHAIKYSDGIKQVAEQVCSLKADLSDNNLVIVIGTNKGLCGNFNDRVMSLVFNFAGINKTSLYTFGKNLRRLKARKLDIFAEDNTIVQKYSLETISTVANKVFSWQQETNGSIYVAYNEYKSIMVQVPKLLKIWPFESKESDAFLLEPSREALSSPVLLQYLTSMINRCVVESDLGELNSRMIVVKGAADTSSDMSTELKLKINKTRQADITSELSEIVSSISALNEGVE